MDFQFKKSNEQTFFKLLPEEWKESIVPFWEYYRDSSVIYALYQENQLIAGGIIFNKCSPDMMYNEIEAKKWFNKGYLYLGFIWVVEEFRDNKIGSKWLQSLKDKFPTQKFWLTIDEENLALFYIKNGFKLITTLKNEHDTEWLLTYEPS
ncbi:MAG: GNAT family N-acetyltransferase [Flavobacteriales bacterium]